MWALCSAVPTERGTPDHLRVMFPERRRGERFPPRSLGQLTPHGIPYIVRGGVCRPDVTTTEGANMSTKSSKSIRIGRDKIRQAQDLARTALGRDVTERQAVELCVSAQSAGALDAALDRVVAHAHEWATARIHDRDAMWTRLLLAFATRETGDTWKITVADGRPWLHRSDAAATTGEPLAAVDLDGLVKELRAGGALEETQELN